MEITFEYNIFFCSDSLDSCIKNYVLSFRRFRLKIKRRRTRPKQRFSSQKPNLLLCICYFQRTYKMATEVYNWVQKYDADLENRQVCGLKIKKYTHKYMFGFVISWKSKLYALRLSTDVPWVKYLLPLVIHNMWSQTYVVTLFYFE